MFQCPACQNPIVDEDFGLVTCSGCHTILLVEWDGSVRTHEDVEKSSAKDAKEVANHIEEGDEEKEEEERQRAKIEEARGEASEKELPAEREEEVPWDETPEEEPPAEREEEVPWDETPEPPVEGKEEVPEEAELGKVAPTENSNIWAEPKQKIQSSQPNDKAGARDSQWSGSDWSEGETLEPQVEEPLPQKVSTDFSDISAFGNSDFSGAPDGILKFNIYIKGIDNSEVLDFIRESLLDERFMWNVDELLGNIQNGELELRDISPVKASIVVNRLKALPLEIRWEQYAIHQV